MSLIDRITEEARSTSEQVQQQVLDFTLFLKQKEQRKLDEDIDKIIMENLEAFKELAK